MTNWTKYELDLLRELHGKETAKKIGERIGRTKRAVAQKASIIGLRMKKQTQYKLMKDTYWERVND